MSSNLDAIVSKIRETRANKKVSLQDKQDKLKKEREAVLITQNKVASVVNLHADLRDAMPVSYFNSTIAILDEGIKKCEVALLRLNRESINIAVAGKARQGKSQLLQMMTGLDDNQIPTGDGGFCTAARNVVVNGREEKAIVFYLTENELLEKKVWQVYKELNLSPMPISIDAFIDNNLPEISPTNCASSTYNNWEKVVQLQKDLRADSNLRSKLSIQKESVSLENVRKALVKDNGETWYQVVDHVEITTPFEVNLPQGMQVIDLPGLEDPTPGIKETMLKSVSGDADIVLLLRKPNPTGDDWTDKDLEVMDDLKKVYADVNIQPQDWVQCVLNLDNREGLCNKNNVDRMKNSSKAGFEPVVCDCGSKEAVREMIDANVDALIRQASKIDDLRIGQAENAFKSAQAELSALYNALRNATSDIVMKDDGFDFDEHLLKFMGDLRDPFKHGINAEFLNSICEILSNHFKATAKDFDDIYAANEQNEKFPDALPVFSKEQLFHKYRASAGASMVLPDAARNQREALLKLVRIHFDNCTSELVGKYYDCVYEYGFKNSPAINMILSGVDTNNISSREKIERLLSQFEKCGGLSTLTAAVEKLLDFNLSFDGTILPSFFALDGFRDFDPELNTTDFEMVLNHITKQDNSEDRAEICYNWLKSKSQEILGAASSFREDGPLSEINSYVKKSMHANFAAFTYRLIWGADCEKEWKRFVKENKAIFWKDEFEKAQMKSQIGKDWNNALRALSEFVR